MKVGMLVFLVAMGLGVLISIKSYYRLGYRSQLTRDPAAIRKGFDFSDLEGTALSAAAKQRLLENVSVVREGGGVAVELGHFVLKGREGKEFACEHFDKIQIFFEAEGVASSGEKPKMELDGVCEVASDVNRIAPLRIPVDRIVGLTPGDGEMEFFDAQRVALKFENVFDTWPKLWVLKGIRMYNSKQPGEEMAVTTEDIAHLSPTPVLVEW